MRENQANLIQSVRNQSIKIQANRYCGLIFPTLKDLS